MSSLAALILIPFSTNRRTIVFLIGAIKALIPLWSTALTLIPLSVPILIHVRAACTNDFVDLLFRIMATGHGKRISAGTRVSYFLIDVDAISLEQNGNTLVIFYYSRSVSTVAEAAEDLWGCEVGNFHSRWRKRRRINKRTVGAHQWCMDYLYFPLTISFNLYSQNSVKMYLYYETFGFWMCISKRTTKQYLSFELLNGWRNTMLRLT